MEYMKKILPFLFYVLFITPIISMEIETECHVYSQSPSPRHLDFLKTNINFNDLIKTQQKERIEIHLFWATGRPYHLLKDEYQADRIVNIGGSDWTPKFYLYLQEFLKFVPGNVNVVFVGDRLTLESNESIFRSLTSEFGNQFQTVLWESLSENIYRKYPEHAPLLQRFFNQAFRGNPAIASDVYRRIGMPLACIGETSVQFDKIMWTYTDVDTFLHGFGDKGSCDYMDALLRTISGNVFCKKSNINDVVKLSFSDKKSYDAYIEYTIDQLSGIETAYCANDEIHMMNYISTLISFVENVDFEGYLKQYSSNIDGNSEGDIPQSTGNDFFNPHNNFFRDEKIEFSRECLEYPRIITGEWRPLARYTHRSNGAYLFYDLIEKYSFSTGQECINQLYSHYANDSEYYGYMREKFRMYIPHLNRAMITKCFGTAHPFNVSFVNWLKDNNPYMSDIHLKYLGKYAESLPGKFVQLRTEMSNAEAYFQKDLENGHVMSMDYPDYFRMTTLMKNLGIDFPLVPDEIENKD